MRQKDGHAYKHALLRIHSRTEQGNEDERPKLQLQLTRLVHAGVKDAHEHDHGAQARDEAQDERDDGDLEHGPALRALLGDDLVVRDGNHGAVVQDGDDHERDDGQRERGGRVQVLLQAYVRV